MCTKKDLGLELLITIAISALNLSEMQCLTLQVK